MKQEDNGKRDANNANRDKAENGVVRPVTGISLAIIVFLLFGGLIFLVVHDYIPDNAKKAEILLASMFSLAIVIVVIVQAGIYFKQAKTFDAQLEETRKATRYGQSAYITVQTLTLTKFTVGEPMEIKLVLVNSGNTPAYNVVCYATGGIQEEPFSFSRTEFMARFLDNVRDAGDLNPVPSKATIGPHDISSEILEWKEPLTAVHVAIEEITPCHVWGVVTYSDIFKRSRWTQFCYQRRPGARDFYVCGESNQTDDQE